MNAAPPALDETERRERLHLVARLGWECAEQAEQLLKTGKFNGWTLIDLRKRYLALTSKLDTEHAILRSGFRIDDEFIQWEKTYGAEVRALQYQIYHPFR